MIRRSAFADPARVGSLILALACVASVAASVAPHDRFFWRNFAGYWLTPSAVLAAAFVFRAAPPVLVGLGVSLALFLAGFHAWALSLGRDGAMAWLGYVLAVPGALLGLAASRWASHTPWRHLGLAIAASAVGLALAMGLICSTMMACFG